MILNPDPRDDPEQAVDTMIARGKAIIQEVIELYRPIAVVAMFSGGNDSIVATHFAVSNIPGCRVFHADTLVGLSPTHEHVLKCAKTEKWDITIGQATAEGPPKKMRLNGKLVPFDEAILPAGKWTDADRAYEEYTLNWGFPGRSKPQHARMYQRLKERPIRRFLKTLGAKAGSPIMLISGVRHDESAIRAGYKRAYAMGRMNDLWVNPFYYSTAGEFAVYRDEFGLPQNPVKRTCGISGECCCGTFGSNAERQAYQMVDPAFDAYLSDLESRVESNGFPWKWGESPPKWWKDARRGQGYLFDVADDQCKFQPMCVGCSRGKR